MSETDDDEQRGEEREFIIREHLDAAGVPRSDLWRNGLEDLSNLDVVGDSQWLPIGPAPLTVPQGADLLSNQGTGPNAGEITDIAIDPSGSTDRIIYIATNDGGIWKTTNADTPNPTWKQKTDFMRSLSMGAVALDPSNPEIVYAGTGNLFDGGAAFTKGVGIYKSIDGGETWAHIDGGVFATIFANIGINRIVLPASDILLVATNKGLFRSVDGGMNFGKAPDFKDGSAILAGNISSLRLDTVLRSTVYASVSTKGIFKSTDSGATFPTTALFVPPPPFDDIAFAQSFPVLPSVLTTMYASVQQGTRPASFKDLYKSTDGGLNWKALQNAHSAADDSSSSGKDQTNFDLTVGVDPQNPDIVYIGFQQLYRSADAGANFQLPACTRGKVHADHHALVFSPASHWDGPPPLPQVLRTRVYVGTDGGIAKSDDAGANWQNQNGSIASNLFLGIDIGRGAKNGYTYGGMQDTGTGGHRPADLPAPADAHLKWHTGESGDGGVVAVDPVNPEIVYGFANEFFMKTTNGGAQGLGNPAENQRWVRTNKLRITGVSNASPILITAASHQLNTGNFVVISGVTVNPGANGTWTVNKIDSNTFRLGNPTRKGAFIHGSPGRPGFEINDATNTTPIEIELFSRTLVKAGDMIEVSGVEGNTAANGIWIVKQNAGDNTVTFHLEGSQGNGNYVKDTGIAIGPLIGEGLGNEPDSTRRVALAPNGVNPATVVYVSEAAKLYKSVDAGINFVLSKDFSNNLPKKVVTQDVTAIACPDANQVWVGLADATVHFSGDGGATWDMPSFQKSFQKTPGGTGSVEGIAVDPNDLSRVAIVYSGMTEINPLFPTRHCYLTINAGLKWTDISGTDGSGPVGNLPDLPLHSVVWDTSTTPPSTAPPTLIVASDAGVLRSADLGTSWQVLGVDLPTVSCQSLAIDNTVSPSVLRVGTYGRSCFELSKPAGRRLIIKSNLAFGAVLTGKSADLLVTLFNVGDKPLDITSLSRTNGSDRFQLTPVPVPFTIAGGSKTELTVRFQPLIEGNLKASFEVQSDDANSLSTLIHASGWGAAVATPRIGVSANLNFGTVKGGESRELPVRIVNTGLKDLNITNITPTSGSNSDFEIVGPTHFSHIAAGHEIKLSIRFKPLGNDDRQADFEIESDDPRKLRTIKAKGTGTSVAGISTATILAVLGLLGFVTLTLIDLLNESKRNR